MGGLPRAFLRTRLTNSPEDMPPRRSVITTTSGLWVWQWRRAVAAFGGFCKLKSIAAEETRQLAQFRTVGIDQKALCHVD